MQSPPTKHLAGVEIVLTGCWNDWSGAALADDNGKIKLTRGTMRSNCAVLAQHACVAVEISWASS